ncbi:MAG: hypothetical protein IKQ46_06645 [Bacteroidales bacterium]|nr:hypothetical protein [Bacteroidales bacterium]
MSVDFDKNASIFLMNKKIIIASVALVVLIVGIICYFLILKPYLIENEVHIAEKIHLLKEETIPIRYKIVSRPDGEIIAAKFFDLDGKVVGRFETAYNDGDILLEFTNIDINLHHIFLPAKMKFIKNGEVNSIELTDYYIRDNYPQIYNSTMIDPILKKEIGKISTLLRESKEETVAKKYGGITVSRVSLTHPCEGVMYELKITTNGDISYSNN